jgi:hypothetical protein
MYIHYWGSPSHLQEQECFGTLWQQLWWSAMRRSNNVRGEEACLERTEWMHMHSQSPSAHWSIAQHAYEDETWRAAAMIQAWLTSKSKYSSPRVRIHVHKTLSHEGGSIHSLHKCITTCICAPLTILCMATRAAVTHRMLMSLLHFMVTWGHQTTCRHARCLMLGGINRWDLYLARAERQAIARTLP